MVGPAVPTGVLDGVGVEHHHALRGPTEVGDAVGVEPELGVDLLRRTGRNRHEVMVNPLPDERRTLVVDLGLCGGVPPDVALDARHVDSPAVALGGDLVQEGVDVGTTLVILEHCIVHDALLRRFVRLSRRGGRGRATCFRVGIRFAVA